MTIHVLSEQTINKIAAGEVVENPSSAIKELVENGIDAGATEISVEIERGGFSLIRVSDNGKGMLKDDLLLSIQRHATSKIKTAEDLIEVLTMGFRGEALASIAAVSKMKIVTCPQKEGKGQELSCNGGKLSEPLHAPREQGTTVEVRSLFYNVPARLKFQKSHVSSQNSVTKLMTKFALSYPEITFRYFADGKELLYSAAASLKDKALDLMDGHFCKDALEVDFTEEFLAMKGLLGDPSVAKSNRLGQHLFVNGRSIFSPEILKAIYDGYGTRLEPRLHPQFVLHVTLPPHWIDVNVHPQKREIRLKDPLKIQEMIRKGIFQAFRKTSEAETPKQVWEINTPLKLQETFELPPAEETFSIVQEEIVFVGIFESYAIIHPTKLIDLPSEEGLILVDLEGAQARIRYERFLNKKPLPMQALLFPVAVNLLPYEKGQLDPHLEEIRGMGVDLRSFGDNCFIIDALTPDLDEKELQGLLEELADVYDQHLLDSFREKKLALSAAYFARSGKRTWGIMEAKQVIKALLKTSSPYHTPKGEKTMVDLSHDAIKKLFQKKSR